MHSLAPQISGAELLAQLLVVRVRV